MAKRHIDTLLYDREWFQVLHPVYKCFWHYICGKCDHAGIWEVNMRLAQFSIDSEISTGIELDYDNVLKVFDMRIVDLGRNKWYIAKYVMYHQGSILYANNNFHMSIIKVLNKYNLVDEDVDGNYFVRMLPYEDKNNKIAKTVKKSTNKRFIAPNLKECVDFFIEKDYTNAESEANKFWNFYESKGWMVGKNKMKKWHAAVANSMSDKNNNNDDGTHIQEGHLEQKRDW